MDAWVIGFKEKLRVASQDYVAVSRKDAIVHRVPDDLKDQSRTKDYTPRVVSIGPYHRGSAPLQEMERHKWVILQQFLDRTGQDVKLYLDSMKELEPRARACYGKEFELISSDQFVEMMLLDGCFMLEILQLDRLRKLRYATEDPIFSRVRSIYAIMRDMTMLENQIPLFVLDKLLGLQPETYSGGERSVLVIADKLFGHLMPSMGKATEGLHCLDVVREKILNGWPKQLEDDGRRQKLSDCAAALSDVSSRMLRKGIHGVRKLIMNGESDVEGGEDEKREELNYCATELMNAGIKLRKGDPNKSLLNIEFRKGTLHIPQIQIDNGFKSLFSNLIAFEQCCLHSRQRHVTSYVFFLDGLIDSTEDVRCLRNHKIIKNYLGSDAEVANIINSLGSDVFINSKVNYLSPLSCRINNYRNRNWNIWRATLKKRYFNNPWAIISFVAGVLLLIMTAAQTYYAVYSYYRSK